jgi:hypothetical protein
MTLTQKLRIYSAKWKEGKCIFKWKGCGRKWLSRNLKYYPSICLEGLRNTTKTLSQDSRSPGQDLNPEILEYEAGVLSTRQRLRYSRVQRTGTFGTIEKPPSPMRSLSETEGGCTLQHSAAALELCELYGPQGVWRCTATQKGSWMEGESRSEGRMDLDYLASAAKTKISK